MAAALDTSPARRLRPASTVCRRNKDLAFDEARAKKLAIWHAMIVQIERGLQLVKLSAGEVSAATW